MLKNIFKLICLFLFATILHWGCLALFGPWEMSVSVLLVFMIAVCVCLSPAYGYPTAFVCGLFLDFFGVKLFGNHAFVFTCCAMAVYGMEKRLDLDSVLVQMVCVLGLCLATSLVSGLLLKIFAGFVAWNGWFAFIGGVVLSVLITPFIFWVVRQAFPMQLKKY